MIYIELDDYFKYIFNDIRELAYDDKTKPKYENEENGLKRLSGVLELVKDDRYYPGFYKKAAYLFLSLSTGHNFSNGNKRIALFSYIYFSHRNRFIYRSIRKNIYKDWFKKNFPQYDLSENSFNSNIRWALYNFNKAINVKKTENVTGHEYSFDDLKDITEDFLQFISRKKTTV